jgi:hypothetical protein
MLSARHGDEYLSDFIFVVTGWKASSGDYVQECAGFRAAKMFCEGAKRKGFLNVKAIDQNEKVWTSEEINKAIDRSASLEGNV